jgi:NifB/MoaA-like Fe-S oxidoreductase
LSPTDWSGIVYAYFFVGTATVYGLFRAFHHAVKTSIEIAIAPICDDLQKIKYQLYNNGGESMKDAIDRIERDAIELKINQAIIKAKIESQ